MSRYQPCMLWVWLTAVLVASPHAIAQTAWAPVSTAHTIPYSLDTLKAHAVGPAGEVYAVVATRYYLSRDLTSTFYGARFEAADGTTRALPTFTAPGLNFAPELAVDARGRLHMWWPVNMPQATTWLTAYARFDPASWQWTPPVLAPGVPSGANRHAAKVLPTDHVVLFSAGLITTIAVLDPATDVWSGPYPSSAPIGVTSAGSMVVAGSKVYTSWLDSAFDRRQHVQWFDAAQRTTGPDSTIPVPFHSSPATIGVGADGTTVAAWHVMGILYTARWTPSSGVWTPPDLVQATGWTGGISVVVDTGGTATLITHTSVIEAGVPVERVEARRQAAGAAAWTTPVAVAPHPGYGWPPSPEGNAVVDDRGVVTVFIQGFAGSHVTACRYSPGAARWSSTVLGENESAANLRFRLIGGSDVAVSWMAGAGLTSIRTTRWSGRLAAPAITTVTSAAGALTVGFAPGATYVEPEYAATSVEVSLDGGVVWHARPAASPVILSGLDDGATYSLRLRGVGASGLGSASPPLSVRSGTTTRPTGLRVAGRQGPTVTLAWCPPAGLEPTSYAIEGGTAPGQTAASLPTHGPAAQFTLSLPTGRFHVRVVALRGAALLGVSDEIVVDTRGIAPDPPSALLGTAHGSTVSLSWTNAPVAGATMSGLVVSVSGTATTRLVLPVTESFSFPSVPAGTYTFAVQALSPEGTSAPSNRVTLTFPGGCSGPPQPPRVFVATSQAGRLHLDWLPPSAGEAVTGYALSVSGRIVGTFPMAARSHALAVPGGHYTLSLASVGGCGASAPAATQTLVVP